MLGQASEDDELGDDEMTDRASSRAGGGLRTRLTVVAVLHVLFAVIFLGMAALAATFIVDGRGFVTPFGIVGVTGAAGVLLVIVALLRARSALGDDQVDRAGLDRAARLARGGLVVELLGAAAALLVGAGLALTNDDALADLMLTVLAVIPLLVVSMSAHTAGRIIRHGR